MIKLLAHHQEAAEMLRLLALLLGGAVLGLTIFVVRLYRYARRLSYKSGSTPGGVTPYHVALIATSHLLLIVVAIVLIVGHDDSDDIIWYGAPVMTISFVLSILGLVDLLRYEDSRIKSSLRTLQPHHNKEERWSS